MWVITVLWGSTIIHFQERVMQLDSRVSEIPVPDEPTVTASMDVSNEIIVLSEIVEFFEYGKPMKNSSEFYVQKAKEQKVELYEQTGIVKSNNYYDNTCRTFWIWNEDAGQAGQFIIENTERVVAKNLIKGELYDRYLSKSGELLINPFK